MAAPTSRSQHTLHSIRDPPQRMLASTARARFTSLPFPSLLLSSQTITATSLLFDASTATGRPEAETEA